MDNQKYNYRIKQKEEHRHLLEDSDGNLIKTHKSTLYPALPLDLATLLVDDLNSIHKRNKQQKKMSDDELRESFVYCVLSTFIEAPNDYVHDIHLDALQWDRVFRLNPGPPSLLVEMRAVEPLKKAMQSGWVNLPLNYAQSIEEMKEDEYAAFVPDEIIKEAEVLLNNFSRHQRFELLLLGNFYENFSLMAILLLITNKLTPQEFMEMFVAFQHGLEPNEFDEMINEYCDYHVKRLEYLEAFNTMVGKKDIKEFIEE